MPKVALQHGEVTIAANKGLQARRQRQPSSMTSAAGGGLAVVRGPVASIGWLCSNDDVWGALAASAATFAAARRSAWHQLCVVGVGVEVQVDPCVGSLVRATLVALGGLWVDGHGYGAPYVGVVCTRKGVK